VRDLHAGAQSGDPHCVRDVALNTVGILPNFNEYYGQNPQMNCFSPKPMRQ